MLDRSPNPHIVLVLVHTTAWVLRIRADVPCLRDSVNNSKIELVSVEPRMEVKNSTAKSVTTARYVNKAKICFKTYF